MPQAEPIEAIQAQLREASREEALTVASMALQMALVRGPNTDALRDSLTAVLRERQVSDAA